MSKRWRMIGRQAALLVMGAVWIIPLYLVLINAVTPSDDYAAKAV